MPDDREARLRGLLYQLHPVGLPGGVDLREAGEVKKGLVVRVDLVVDLGYCALVEPIVGLRDFGLETQPSACNGRERERIADPFRVVVVGEPSCDHQIGSALLDAVYGLVGMQLCYLVLEGQMRPRLADRLLSLGGRDETLSGDALPQYPFRPGAVSNAENEVGR